MANRFQTAFPNGSDVLALHPEHNHMEPGVVLIHTEDRATHDGNGLNVRFADGTVSEFPYSYIDLADQANSYVVKA